MNAPLAHYFMYTGHNSYLTGNQLSSDSSVQPIIRALQRGVRVIELDLWPSANKDNVEVRHGGYESNFHLFQTLLILVMRSTHFMVLNENVCVCVMVCSYGVKSSPERFIQTFSFFWSFYSSLNHA